MKTKTYSTPPDVWQKMCESAQGWQQRNENHEIFKPPILSNITGQLAVSLPTLISFRTERKNKSEVQSSAQEMTLSIMAKMGDSKHWYSKQHLAWNILRPIFLTTLQLSIESYWISMFWQKPEPPCCLVIICCLCMNLCPYECKWMSPFIYLFFITKTMPISSLNYS